ncbi:MAG: PAS domain-containing protein [Myxococcota bacterium]|nr:PAS domain-containing protein [Myxococcota bacterium]
MAVSTLPALTARTTAAAAHARPREVDAVKLNGDAMSEEGRSESESTDKGGPEPLVPSEAKNEEANQGGNGSGEGSAGAALERPTPKGAGKDSSSGETEVPAPKFFIVGVGASAGGLDALGDLLASIKLDGMAFVIVQHLAPDHESLLAELLSRTSKILQVATATDGRKVEPNHVYVIPPNANLALMHGVIHLVAPVSDSGPKLSIDFFFRSLADDQGASAIGIILSGTGTDGTFGLKAIKAAGGMTFVQEPSSAKYDGMPRSALSSGHADFCLAPHEIAQELTRISKRPALATLPKPPTVTPGIQEHLGKLFVLIRSEFGIDLADYKPSTVERRIDRRMMMHRIETLQNYVKYVQSNPQEVGALYKDMLIAVTQFFRDHDPFEALKTRVFPHLVEKRDPNAPIRVWVPACATGEEAYSIAICLTEFLEERGAGTRIQIFGTDIDVESIQYARRGVYPQNIALDVTPDRLSRFFVKKDDEYQVSRRVRDMVVFSNQNILKDAPFSRLDLVSCRNLLIYLQPPAQKKVLRTLHYSLNPLGLLLLGTSETVGDSPDLFSLVDRKIKLYTKKHFASVSAPDIGLGVPATPDVIRPAAPTRPTTNLAGLAERKVLEMYGPPGVVVNEQFDILHFRGHTGPYLDPAPGAASLNILRVARAELHIELKRALQRCLSEQVRVTAEVPFHDEGKAGAVQLDVVPIQEPETKTRCLLVLFHKMTSPKVVPVATADGDAKPALAALAALAQSNQELERELAITKEYLQETIGEKETANEELKSANEELQSSNEELQSANEELETSQEEMQSTNEELTTVNDELQSRMAELSRTSDDLHNILSGIDNAVIIVGMDFRIRRYTTAAEKLLNLVPGDVGRSISHIDAFVGGITIEQKVSGVIESLAPVEEEILCANHRFYALRIAPYRTLDHSIRGAIVNLVDIDVRKKAAELTHDVGQYAERFLGAIGHPLLILDAKLRILWANDLYYKTFQVTIEETIGSTISNVREQQWTDPSLREALERALREGTSFRDLRVRHRFQQGRERTLRIGGSRIPMVTEASLVLVSIEDDHSRAQGTKEKG